MTVDRFRVEVTDDQIDDLHQRLDATHFASERDTTWDYGLPTALLEEWVDRWRRFDWRRAEARINQYEHFRTEVSGTTLHFLRRDGVGPRPVPLLLVHGWPWTFWDWHATIDPLADPGAHGGDPRDAFDVVVVSLPGSAFSRPVGREPMGYTQMAEVLVALMREELGFGRFAVAGGDMGSLTTLQLGHAHADALIGAHTFGLVPLNVFAHGLAVGPDFGMPPRDPNVELPRELETPTARARLAPSAHLTVNSVEPQTLAAALIDSPAGLLACLLHRRAAWSDHDGDVLDAFDEDFLLTTFSLYWYSGCIGSSMRRYHDMVFHPWQPSHDRTPVVQAPTGVTFFDGDLLTSRSRHWVREYVELVRVTSYERGGHFAPAERPDVAVDEIRATFRELR
jgi:microsomal epoxide hydrolase